DGGKLIACAHGQQLDDAILAADRNSPGLQVWTESQFAVAARCERGETLRNRFRQRVPKVGAFILLRLAQRFSQQLPGLILEFHLVCPLPGRFEFAGSILGSLPGHLATHLLQGAALLSNLAIDLIELTASL